MPGCAVRACKNWNGNTKNMNIKFFSFPRNPELAEKWNQACSAQDINFKHARVCSVHFKPECFQDKSHLQIPGKPPILKLKKNSIPTENLSLPIIRVLSKKEILQKKQEKNKMKENNIVQVVEYDYEDVSTDQEATTEKSTSEIVEFDPEVSQPVQEKIKIEKKNAVEIIEFDPVEIAAQNSFVKSSPSAQKKEIPVIRQIQKQKLNHAVPVITVQKKNKASPLTSPVQAVRIITKQQNQDHNYCTSTEESTEDLRYKNLCRRTEILETEVERLKAENKYLNEKLNIQEKYFETKVKEKVNKILTSIFSSGKVKRFASNQVCIKLTKSDISNAIVLANYKS